MNTVILAGELVDNALLRGTKVKALIFTVQTKTGLKDSEGKEQTTCVPAVMFNPGESLGQRLVEQGKGQFVLFQGRVEGTRFDQRNGQEHYNAEVVVYNKSFILAIPQVPSGEQAQ